MKIAIPLYPGFAATDAIGPYEVLARLPRTEIRFVASRPGAIDADTGFLHVHADPLSALPRPDVVVVPGGAPNARLPLQDRALLDWLVEADRHTQWTASVCTGAWILGAAGLLRGKRATTHWLDGEGIGRYGGTLVKARYVFDGKLVTAAGVSAGFDMALALAARIAGDEVAQAIQLGIEYDPQPPFDCGHPDKASPATIERVRRRVTAGAV